MDKEKLNKLLSDYFGLNSAVGTYTYKLTRCKTAFEVGTITLDDFEEIDETDVEDLAEFLIEKLNFTEAG